MNAFIVMVYYPLELIFCFGIVPTLRHKKYDALKMEEKIDLSLHKLIYLWARLFSNCLKFAKQHCPDGFLSLQAHSPDFVR